MLKKFTHFAHTLIGCLLFLSINIQTSLAQSGYSVETFGQLRLIIQQADISANADLADFADKTNFYALGAFKNLKGEILIIDGTSYSTRSIDGEVEFIRAFEEKATLLVGSSVEEWQEIKISQTVSNPQDLQKVIEETAAEYGLSMNEPFPFMIEGAFGEIVWHLIDWPEDDHEHTHEKHKTSGPNGILTNTEVKILGFWSDSHHGIFTHHTTNLHMHFVTKDRTLAGHLDDLKTGNNLLLYLPKTDN
ncbi:MAG: acetolactate decarboxylase [Balneolaceae bacterium]|nr:acetolactate decarboxylase [Balneolaceae bacterium]